MLRPNAAAASRSAAARGLPLPPGGRSPEPPGPRALPPPCPKHTQNTPKIHPPAGSASALGLGRLAAVCISGCFLAGRVCVVSVVLADRCPAAGWSHCAQPHTPGMSPGIQMGTGRLSSQRLCGIMNRSLKPPRWLQALGLHVSVSNHASCLLP